ncbi:MAG TPA: hypothetical protein VH539_12160 [Gemmatimonadaceae bacterium]|jgi:hypothetical protein
MADGFTWDDSVRQYRGPGGRFVSRSAIRRIIDRAIAAVSGNVTSLASDLRSGVIGGDEWLAQMEQYVKDVHLFNAAAAKGGWAQLSANDYSRLTSVVRDQLAYLDRFAGQIDGGLALDGRFLARAQLYAEAGRGTFEAIFADMMADDGMSEERNVLGFAEHCEDCLDQTAQGWQPIGTLIPIGDRQCLGRCKCSMEYR